MGKMINNILWSFINFTFATEEYIIASINKGLLEHLTFLIRDPLDKEKHYDMVLGIIANISGTSIGLRNMLFEWQGFEILLQNSEHYFTENAEIQ
jgi:hypothetical protein